MQIPDPPNPDDVVKTMLGWIFGPSSLIVLIFVFCNFAVAWYGAAKAAGRRTRQAYVRVTDLRPGGVEGVALASAVMLLMQTLYLVASYLISAVLSAEFGLRKGVGIPDIAHWSKIPNDPHLETFSASYLVVASLAVAISCYRASRGEGSAFLHYLLGVPGWMCVAVVAFAGFSAAVTKTGLSVSVYAIVVAAIVVYLIIFHTAMNAPHWFFRAWRKGTTGV